MPAPAAAAEHLAEGESDAPRSEVRPAPIPAPTRAEGAHVARIVVASRGRRSLKRARPTVKVSPHTSWSGAQAELMVLRSAFFKGQQWLKLLLADRPNGKSVWLPRDRVVLTRTPYWVTVQIKRRQVKVFRKGRLLHRYGAVVGAPATPTPIGLSAIYERNRQPDPKEFLGPWSLPITFLSAVLESYGGGPGRVAIHGRAGASFQDPLGTAASHGCIRINNAAIRWMARKLPVGTPVQIAR